MKGLIKRVEALEQARGSIKTEPTVRSSLNYYNLSYYAEPFCAFDQCC